MKNIKKDSLISVAFVVFNQSDSVMHAVEKITQTLHRTYNFFEILIVDNGSNDQTQLMIAQLLKYNRHVRGLVLSKQYDIEVAYMAVLDNCIGDFVILMDIQTDPPDFIPTLISTVQQGYDIVKTKKMQKHTLVDKSMKQKIYNFLYRKLLRFEDSPVDSNFLIFNRLAVNSLTLFKNKHPHLHYLSSIVGLRQCTLPYQAIAPTPARALSLYQFVDIIISHTTLPLRLASFIGVIASFLSLLYLLYTLVVALIKERLAEGWLTTSLLNASMFFLLFIILTILSEYIDRLINETKEQPMYIIAEELSSGALPKSTKRANVR